MREELLTAIDGAIRTILREASLPEEPPTFALEIPRQKEHGDFACNAAMVLAKPLRRPPREIAARLVELLAAGGGPIARADFLGEVATAAGAQDQTVASAIEGLTAWAHLPPDEAARWLHAEGLDPAYGDEWQGISAHVIPSVVWSLYSFLRDPDDYWTVICTAIGAGGDTDTMAAIAGAIAGARLGPSALPADLIQQLNDRGAWRAAELADLASRVAALSTP